MVTYYYQCHYVYAYSFSDLDSKWKIYFFFCEFGFYDCTYIEYYFQLDIYQKQKYLDTDYFAYVLGFADNFTFRVKFKNMDLVICLLQPYLKINHKKQTFHTLLSIRENLMWEVCFKSSI